MAKASKPLNSVGGKPVKAAPVAPKRDPKPKHEERVGKKAVRFKCRKMTFIRAADPAKG